MACIFTKDHPFPGRLSTFGGVLAVVTLLSLLLLNIASLFFYLYITLFTPYKHCKEIAIEHYFVTAPDICHKINTHGFSE